MERNGSGALKVLIGSKHIYIFIGFFDTKVRVWVVVSLAIAKIIPLKCKFKFRNKTKIS